MILIIGNDFRNKGWYNVYVLSIVIYAAENSFMNNSDLEHFVIWENMVSENDRYVMESLKEISNICFKILLWENCFGRFVKGNTYNIYFI